MLPPLFLFAPDGAWWWSHACVALAVTVAVGLAWRTAWFRLGRPVLARNGSRVMSFLAAVAVIGLAGREAVALRRTLMGWWALPAASLTISARYPERMVVLHGAEADAVVSWDRAMSLTAWRYRMLAATPVVSSPPR